MDKYGDIYFESVRKKAVDNPVIYLRFRDDGSEQMSTNSPEVQNRIYFIRQYGYLIFSAVLGAIFFYFLPKYLDQLKLLHFDVFGTLMMFYFVIFLNIHHYFIDNVIWKKSNKQMQQYLFPKPAF